MWTEDQRRIYRREGDGYPSDLRDAEIGVGKVWASPPSEPCERFSRTRLSGCWFPHRGCLA
jgi:hypothetical protein